MLERALAGEQVDREQLAAARSLFSYRASEAPRQPSGHGEAQQREGAVYSITGLIKLAVERGVLTVSEVGLAVEGEVVREAPPPPHHEEIERPRESGYPPAPATPADFSTLVEPPAAFDESEAAKLTRRYRSEVEGSTWWHA